MWSIKDDFSLTSGKHNYKMGVAFQSQRAIGFGQQDIAGRAGFSFLTTSVPGATSATSGSSFASFLLGEATFGRTETVRVVPQLYRYYGFYFQDRDGNWWEIQYEPRAIDDFFDAGDKFEMTTGGVETEESHD